MEALMSELFSTTKKDGFRAIKIYGETLRRRRRERGITIIELVEKQVSGKKTSRTWSEEF